jgi:hypothetical protein
VKTVAYQISILLGVCLAFAHADARSLASDDIEPVTAQPKTDIQLALSALSEVEALNAGVLSADRGVFHPKVTVPGQDSKPATVLSNSAQ